MTMNAMEDFLYHLNRYVEAGTEMRSSYEHLTAAEKERVKEAHPVGRSPEEISKDVYKWHDNLFDKMDKTTK
ncbi:hypothetical protein [Halobacillus massiliensis]|uniref:hypothetical protein n=1 Tax=Halobacillus massiliensis TaxID=1926286 RepID=UPI0009E5ED84|nr:hypothetical protein [Halobacillus massiliensis]